VVPSFAFDRNLAEGHDNDGFQVALWTLVEAAPELSTDTLRQLRGRQPPPVTAETVDWLLEFCSEEPVDTSPEISPQTSPLRRALRRWKS
jgi:hypothetical protein